MPTWFERLSLRNKLIGGFSALLVLTLATSGTALLSHRRALATVDTFFDRDDTVDDVSLQSSAAMLQARRNEKDFLLKARDFGFEEAKSRYAGLVESHLATVRENMDLIASLSGDDPAMKAKALTIKDVSVRYEKGFLKVVELYGRLGRRDSGLEGRLRDKAHAIEMLVGQGPSESLLGGLLALRSIEKDFLLRGLDTYVLAFDRKAELYQEEIRRTELPARLKEQLLSLAADYQHSIHEYADIAAEIDAMSMSYLGEVHTAEPLLEELHARAEKSAVQTRNTVARLTRQTTWLVAGASLAAVLLGAMIAFIIAGSINRALRTCVDFAGKIAKGSLSARLKTDASDEFGLLSLALNDMADELQAADQEQALQAGELRRLNRTLRVLSLCNEALVRASSEAELVQTVCRHVVEAGDHRMAWVGYARHDDARSIDPVAHAGTDLDFVEALNLSWSESSDRQGIGGRAICRGGPIVVRDIVSDPIFAPWRENAVARGFSSCIALPLKTKDDILGTLSIYSEEADAFDAEDVKLLRELADDLGYGIANLREAEERRHFERKLEHQAHFDTLTGLANRFTLETRLGQSLADAKRHGMKAAVLFVDLDRFKTVNDTLGRAAGDRVLIEAARRLNIDVRESDTVARLGADEFVVFVKDAETTADVAAVAGRILAQMAPPLTIDGHEIRLSCSIGISVFPDDGADANALVKNADAAMSHAKSLGGSSFRFFAPEMNEHMAERYALETDLRRALQQGELLMHYQPKVSLSSGVITGAEALIRWRHPDKGMVMPGGFIPLAEDTGLIQPMGQWAIAHVCAQMRAWLDAGLSVPPIAVNLSARQFRDEHLLDTVAQALQSHALDARLLELEITESAVMQDVERAIDTVRRLKALGVKISLDDFGTGYSSLSYLKRFPIDQLKIDRSFVRDVTVDADDAAICNAVIGLAHNLKLTVIAEGVETEAQMSYLRRQRCDEMQGYYFNRPMPADDFAQMLAKENKLALPANDDMQRTLLIVDDEANVLSSLNRLLRRDGYKIYTATSAQEGLEILAKHKVQVVLSDQRMPQMKGTEFLNKVKELHPQTIRIILSGYTELESVIDAVNQGAVYRFFTKPWDDEGLRKDLRDAFRHHVLIHGGAFGQQPLPAQRSAENTEAQVA